MSWVKKYLLALLATCLCLGSASAQVIDRAVLNSAVLITYDVETQATTSTESNPLRRPAPGPSLSRGTGFLIFQGLGLTHGIVYLITNKHVLPPQGKKKDIKVRVVVHDKDGTAKVQEVSVPVVGDDGKYLPSVRVHKDPDTDVAAINIAPAAFGGRFQVLIDAVQTRKYLDTSMLLTSDRWEAMGIGVGTQAYVLGFPAAIFDPRNVSPVLRVGVVSTDPAAGFSFNEELRKSMGFPAHVNGFLIDANVYPGSSGSLVLLPPEVPRETAAAASADVNKATKSADGIKAASKTDGSKPEAVKVDTPKPTAAPKPYILGIVSGSIPIYDASLNAYERIGLGIVYSADAIREVIRDFDR